MQGEPPIEELKIETRSYGGDGVVNVNGRFIFVPHTSPGDCVEARVGEFSRGKAWAEVVRVVHPAPSRVAPDCEYYDKCSGCALRHISREDERAWKLNEARIIIDKYGPQHVGPIKWVAEDPRLEFRRRGRFMVTRDEHGKYRLGLNGTGLNRAIVDIRACPAQVSQFREAMKKVGRFLALNSAALTAIEIHTSEAHDLVLLHAGEVSAAWSGALGAYLGNRYKVYWHAQPIYYDSQGVPCDTPTVPQVLAGGVEVECPISSWTHTHARAWHLEAQWAHAQLAPPSTGRVLDGCTGIGTLAAYMLAKGYEVTCIDQDYRGLQAFERAARRRHGDSLRIRAGRIGKVSRKLRQEGELYHQALINPMRKALGKELDDLPGLGVKRIVYLGPSPVSAARDMARLVALGYTLHKVALIDLHPASAQFMLAGSFSAE